MASSKYSFSTILLPAESAQTSRCGPSRATQCHVTQSHILPAAGHPSRATQCHVTGSQILPGAGHNAPHLPLPQPQPVQRQEGVWYSRSHISTDQLAPNPLAELPTTTNLRRARSEAAAGEHRSAVLGINLKEHKAKATKEAQDRRNRNAQASKRSRLKKSAEEKAKVTKREQEMKQELEDTKSESRKKDAEIERLRGVDAEIERLRGVDAENERLRRENEELKQRK
ncbi:hypothetical protein E4U26_007101 [Claviceps purpurea]|nr:hypothetical protein E4U26_007101 [Claviceps purpurea]